MTVSKPDEMASSDELVREISDVFSSQGCISQEYNSQLKPKCKPVVHAARKIAISLRDKVEKELDQMEKLKICRMG